MYFTDLFDPLGLKEGKGGHGCCTGQHRAVLTTCLTSPSAQNKDWRASGEQQPQQLNPPASFDVGHCRQGGRQARFFSFLSLLARICQRNHKQRTLQFPFPPKEA